MEDSLNQKVVNYIERHIESFENEKFLEKNKNRKLGIIYTPSKVVDYIISNIFRIYFERYISFNKETKDEPNVKEIFLSAIKNQKTKQNLIKIIKNLRILDPSCGSGRFLISVAEKLYQLYRILEPNLSDFEIKKAIIEKNLYGIEIEHSAIIISKLRLIKWFLSFNENNVKFKTFNLDFLLEFSSDKFDIIIGNPPYVENKKIKNVEFKKKLTKRFKSAYRLFDLSVIFIERSLELLADDGYISFILPNKFLSADYGIKIRLLLLNESEIKEIVNISSLPIFQNTATYPIILSLKKAKYSEEQEVKIKIFNNMNDLIENNRIKTIKFHQKLIKKLPSKVIPISGNIELITYLFRNFKTLAESFKDLKIIYRPFGFLKYSKHFDNVSDERRSDNDLLLIGTGNVEKYYVKFNKRIKIAKRDLKIAYFNYNPTFKLIWQDFKNEKIIFREIAKDLTCVYDPGIFTNITGLYLVRIPSIDTEKLYCLLTLLNSKLLDTVFKTLFSSLHMAGGYLRFNGSFVKRLPVPQKFPPTISKCGKIIQILSQLYYDLNSDFIYKNSELEYLKKNYQIEIEKFLRFFLNLSNALVNLLYLDEFYLESNKNFNSIREFLYLKVDLVRIQFKYLLPRYQINKYRTYSIEELKVVLDDIENFFNTIHENKLLLDQIDQILYEDLS